MGSSKSESRDLNFHATMHIKAYSCICCRRLLEPSPHRSQGAHPSRPVLVRADPGTGKTWLTKQAAYFLFEALTAPGKLQKAYNVPLVPLIVYVQRIVYMVRGGSHADNLLQRYIEGVFHGKQLERYRKLLFQAFELKALIVLLDGVDEAAGYKECVEDFIHHELVPSGNRMLITSRPLGVTLSRYTEKFSVLNLKELSVEMKREVIKQQLDGSQFFDHLLALSATQKKLDEQWDRLSKHERRELEGLSTLDLRSAPASETFSQLACGAPFEQSLPLGLEVVQMHELLTQVIPSDHREESLLQYIDHLVPRIEQAIQQAQVAETPPEKPTKERPTDSSGPPAKLALNEASLPQHVQRWLKKLSKGLQALAPNCDSITQHRLAQIGGKLGLLALRQRAKVADITAAALWNQVNHLYSCALALQPAFKQHITAAASRAQQEQGSTASAAETVIAVRFCEDGAAERLPSVLELLNGLLSVCDGSRTIAPLLVARVSCGVSSQCARFLSELGGSGQNVEPTDELQNDEECCDDADDESISGVLLTSEMAPVQAPKKADGIYLTSLRYAVLRYRYYFCTGVLPGSSVSQLGIAFWIVVQRVLTVLSLICLRNRFVDLDSIHLRHASCSVLVVQGGIATWAEVEVHHKSIYRVAAESDAKKHFEFFQQRQARAQAESLGAELALKGGISDVRTPQVHSEEILMLQHLEHALRFLVDATGVPVLLSMLVLIFASAGERIGDLPTNQRELCAPKRPKPQTIFLPP